MIGGTSQDEGQGLQDVGLQAFPFRRARGPPRDAGRGAGGSPLGGAEEPSSTRGRRERGRGCPGDTGPPHSVRPPLWGPPQVARAYRPPQPGCGEGPGAAGLRQSTRLSWVPFCPGCSAPREGGPRHPPPSLSVGAAVTRLCGSCHARGSAGPRALQPPHSPPPFRAASAAFTGRSRCPAQRLWGGSPPPRTPSQLCRQPRAAPCQQQCDATSSPSAPGLGPTQTLGALRGLLPPGDPPGEEDTTPPPLRGTASS